MNILKRLYRIARASMPQGSDFFSEERNEYQGEKFEERYDWDRQKEQGFGDNSNDRNDYSSNKQTNTYGMPQQVLDDLGVFELAPPSSLAEVKKARNREIKKFHSDKFMNNPDKMETSKQIMQIINAAYDRLEKYYEQKI